MKFIAKYMELELTYRWVQLTQEEAIRLEEDGQLAVNLTYYTYQKDSVPMREYHLDDSPCLQGRVMVPYGRYASPQTNSNEIWLTHRSSKCSVTVPPKTDTGTTTR